AVAARRCTTRDRTVPPGGDGRREDRGRLADVSGPLFEQYREALRRGHLSTLAGNLEDALEAYREAAHLVPDRTLALASHGTLLHQLDRWPEAAAAFDSALRLVPDDESTLRARATARAERGMRSGAAAG